MKTTYKSLLEKWTLRRWRPVVFAAHGHVSAVFKVRRLHTLSKYALKVFRGEESEERIGAFRRGIALGADKRLAGLVPKCIELKDERDEIYAVTEWVEPVPERMSLRRFIGFFTELCDVVAAFHERGIMICDLKRENIGILHGRVAIVDLDCAQTFQEAEEDPSYAGTWEYMCEEMKRHGKIDRRVDVFSLGKMADALHPRRYRRMFAPLIDHATQEEREKRTPDVPTFRRELLACESDYMREMSRASRLPKFRRIAAVAAVTLAAVVLGTVIVLALVGSHTVDKALSQSGPRLRMEVYRKAAAYERRSGDQTNAVRLLERALKDGAGAK